ncbi:collectin-11 [Elysia marginata]|uniref:Collectin-11 n=1 Tax=Elysia marginata TaxID=1093978 RepID=A0AAV4GKT1_9GAST|nr:collectin-11 [Elysia marginata]
MSPLVVSSAYLLLAAVSAAAEVSVDDACPSSLVTSVNRFYLQVYDGTCFHFVVNYRRTFEDATEQCLKDGGLLAMPKTPAVNDFLAKQSFEHYGAINEMWIGLNDQSSEGQYVWSDDNPLEWSHFARGNGPTSYWILQQFEDCVALDPLDGLWHDFMCKEDMISASFGSEPKKSYICQYSVAPEPSLVDGGK